MYMYVMYDTYLRTHLDDLSEVKRYIFESFLGVHTNPTPLTPQQVNSIVGLFRWLWANSKGSIKEK